MHGVGEQDAMQIMPYIVFSWLLCQSPVPKALANNDTECN